MQRIDKAIATAAVWGAVCGLSYLFHSFNILSGGGAGAMVVAAVIGTWLIWENN